MGNAKGFDAALDWPREHRPLAGRFRRPAETNITAAPKDCTAKCAKYAKHPKAAYLWALGVSAVCLHWAGVRAAVVPARCAQNRPVSIRACAHHPARENDSALSADRQANAVGKKNWLFIGHPEVGWRSAVTYPVIVSCRRRGIDPWEYVRDVLNRLPGMKQTELWSLQPRCWKPSDKPTN